MYSIPMVMVTAGHDHCLTKSEDGTWSSDFFDQENVNRRMLEAFANGTVGEQPGSFREDIEARIRMLEFLVSNGLLATKDEIYAFNQLCESDSGYGWFIDKLEKLCSVQPRCIGPYSTGIRRDVFKRFTLFVLCSTAPRWGWSLERSVGFLGGQQVRTDRLEDYEFIIQQMALDADQVQYIQQTEATKGFPTWDSSATLHPISGIHLFQHNLSAMTPTKIINIIQHIEQTMPIVEECNRENVVSKINTVTTWHWASYMLIYGWYETACWLGYGKEALPAFVKCFDRPNDFFFDTQEDPETPIVDKQAYWNSLSMGDHFYRSRMQLLLPQLFADVNMLRALYREHWTHPFYCREDKVSPRDLFPSTRDIIEATSPDGLAYQRFSAALEEAEELHGEKVRERFATHECYACKCLGCQLRKPLQP